MDDAKRETDGEVLEQVRRAAAGDEGALRTVFAAHRDRLERMVHLRRSRRLAGRVDDSDVLQEAFVEAARKLPEYVQEALNGMDPIDREVLALKHFEQLSTAEIAEVLGLSKAGAGSRSLRAIQRLRSILEQIPGFEAF